MSALFKGEMSGAGTGSGDDGANVGINPITDETEAVLQKEMLDEMWKEFGERRHHPHQWEPEQDEMKRSKAVQSPALKTDASKDDGRLKYTPRQPPFAVLSSHGQNGSEEERTTFGYRTNLQEYKMKSDIFGNNTSSPQYSRRRNVKPCITSPFRVTGGIPAGLPSSTNKVPVTDEARNYVISGADGNLVQYKPRRNLRESGGNPLTGEGYPTQDRFGSGNRRVFHPSKSDTSLW